MLLMAEILHQSSFFFQDQNTPAVEVQTPPLEGPKILRVIWIFPKIGVPQNHPF